MKITKALILAKNHIYVGYHGGYYVAQPFYGLTDVNGPTLAPTTTTDYHNALAHCRARRISAVIAAVTGDELFALDCEEGALDGQNFDPDWRIQCRRFLRQHGDY